MKKQKTKNKLLKCACCGNFTIEDEYETCLICNWSKDFIQEEDHDYWGGANDMSLNQAKEAYKKGLPIK
ncbi:MAG: CPCC family cysteine-rich protein [Clostridium sp.]